MNVLPTLEGGLCILPESDSDWVQLELISVDASRPTHLAESLADLMDPDSEWDEYVVPDLVDTFGVQCRFVAAEVEKARDANERGVFIQSSHAEKWYGALNQARLALEARYKLEELKEATDSEAIDGAESELRSAYFRDRFYLVLQSLLLEHVMGEA